MKNITTKDKLIKTLKTNVSLFNKYMSLWRINNSCIDLTGANLGYTNLTGVNLTGADLTGANLGYTNLTGANLGYTNLTGADLTDANLTGANLTGADLTGANLGGVNLDFCSWSLSCKSLKPKTDKKQRIQLFFHAASLIANANNRTEQEVEIYNNILDYVNRFHRDDVDKLKQL